MAMEQSKLEAAAPLIGAPDVAVVKQWLVAYIADLLEFEQSEVNTSLPLSRYGLASTSAVALTNDLGDWLGCDIDPTLLFEHKTIDALAAFVAANHAKLRKPGK